MIRAMDGDTPEMRLAKALIARRIALGYTKRVRFAQDAGLSHDRTIADLERASGKKHAPATLADIERVYKWEPGSIERILAGGRPVCLPGTPDAPTPAPEQSGQLVRDPVLDAIVEILNSRYGSAAKLAMIEDVVNSDYVPRTLLLPAASSTEAPEQG